MKKIVIIALMLSSCNSQPMKKPFIVVNKSSGISNACIYKYEDANGNWVDFEDQCNKYSIGDTLK